MKRLGLIGRTLGHSFSAQYFTEKFAREGIADEYDYALYELADIAAVEDFILSTEGLVGFNVTIPYKRQIIPFLDEFSDEARNIGAVNCVKIMPDGRRVGYNTDVEGIRLSLDELLGGYMPDEALVLGTGGASQAVQYVLAERDIRFQIVSRSASKGNLTYEDISQETLAAAGLIINTTPVGMYPDVDQAPQIDYSLLTPCHYLFDLVYNPSTTRFLDMGARQGAHTLSGLKMLYAQAEAAWAIWQA